MADGHPPAAHTMDMIANGSEKSVCENMTSSLNIFSFRAVCFNSIEYNHGHLPFVHFLSYLPTSLLPQQAYP